ncbi:MAG: diguanylate cyclase [Helicobacteraceae bacterium]|nr:diguanylate cyclase [Candidatus Sulfurimonas ponti]MBL6972789.1 diguanylate cyclase [Sulfurimonas sp.]
MISYKIKVVFFIVCALLAVNFLVYHAAQTMQADRIDKALENHLNDLQTHYEILLHHQNITAETAYEATVEKPGFIELFSKIASASKSEQTVLRKDLEILVTNIYKRLQKKGVLQYHFVLPDNTAFLRMHKLDKFGDDLSSVRKDFKHVNETKSRMRGFTQGKIAHGFRNVFPLFDADGVHLGAMEISFSSNEFIKYLGEVSKIHTHFLVNKKILDANIWIRDDIVLIYTQSDEHKDFMVTASDEHSSIHCLEGSQELLEEAADEIDEGIQSGEKFSVLLSKDDNLQALSFLPVKNLDTNQTVAWFVSYVTSDFIRMMLQSNKLVRAVLFILLMIVGYLMYRIIINQKRRVLQIRKKAYIDGLTGVNNRNQFDENFEHELLRTKRYKRNLSLALIDIDHFKKFNDDYGHLIGDEVLIMLANDVKKKVRDADTFARWGGEEFVILFPETKKESAQIICEKLRKEIEGLKHPTAGSITVSIGVTSYLDGDTAQSLFRRCDEALYKAKENGRNQVSVV